MTTEPGGGAGSSASRRSRRSIFRPAAVRAHSRGERSSAGDGTFQVPVLPEVRALVLLLMIGALLAIWWLLAPVQQWVVTDAQISGPVAGDGAELVFAVPMDARPFLRPGTELEVGSPEKGEEVFIRASEVTMNVDGGTVRSTQGLTVGNEEARWMVVRALLDGRQADALTGGPVKVTVPLEATSMMASLTGAEIVRGQAP